MLLFNFADVRAGFLSKSVQIFGSPPAQPNSPRLPLIFLFSLEFNTFDCKSPPPFITEHGWYWIHDCIDSLNSNLISIKT